MSRQSSRLRAFVLVGASTLLLTVSALAQRDVPERKVGVHFRDGQARLWFSARDLLSVRSEAKLASGLPQTIQLRVYAYRERQRRAISFAARSCRVTYDLWQEKYRVERMDTEAVSRFSTTDLRVVRERCLSFRDYAVGTPEEFADVGDRRMHFAVLAELNPMSEETARSIRRWLAQPAGRHNDGNAFFGSFVSLFVSPEVGQAERIVKFRSQWVRLGEDDP